MYCTAVSTSVYIFSTKTRGVMVHWPSKVNPDLGSKLFLFSPI